MEKQLSAVGYWLGLICTVLALIFRMLTVFSITTPQMGVSGGNAIGYLSLLHGAGLQNLRSEWPPVSDSIADSTARLRSGINNYRKKGSKFIKGFIAQQKKQYPG